MQHAEEAVDPVTEFRKRVRTGEIIMVSITRGPQDGTRLLHPPRKFARVANGRPLPDFEQMAEITEQPATADTDGVGGGSGRVAALSKLNQQPGEVNPCIDRERKRLPEPANLQWLISTWRD